MNHNPPLLLHEIIPGITHKSRNLLMNISGHLQLMSRATSPAPHQAKCEELIESCNQILLLLNRLEEVMKQQKHPEEEFDLLRCLAPGMEDTPPFLIENHTRITPVWIQGNADRFCLALNFLRQAIVTSDSHTPIRIEVGDEIPEDSPFSHLIRWSHKEWIHLAFFLPQENATEILSYTKFFDPLSPFDLQRCYLAAFAHIMESHGGKIEIPCPQNTELHVILPRATVTALP